MAIDYNKLLPTCPKCGSRRITKTDIYRQGIRRTISGKFKRKEVRKHICKDCKEEWWK